MSDTWETREASLILDNSEGQDARVYRAEAQRLSERLEAMCPQSAAGRLWASIIRTSANEIDWPEIVQDWDEAQAEIEAYGQKEG